jgi:hypothetical protein
MNVKIDATKGDKWEEGAGRSFAFFGKAFQENDMLVHETKG